MQTALFRIQQLKNPASCCPAHFPVPNKELHKMPHLQTEHIKHQVLSTSAARKILPPSPKKNPIVILTVPLQSKSTLKENKPKPVFSRLISKALVLLPVHTNTVFAVTPVTSLLAAAVQLSSSAARLCRFITKQRLARGNPPRPNINSTSHSRKAAWICSGRVENKGCRPAATTASAAEPLLCSGIPFPGSLRARRTRAP